MCFVGVVHILLILKSVFSKDSVVFKHLLLTLDFDQQVSLSLCFLLYMAPCYMFFRYVL